MHRSGAQLIFTPIGVPDGTLLASERRGIGRAWEDQRGAVIMVAAAFVVLFLLAALAHARRWVDFDLEGVGLLCASLVALNVGLAIPDETWLGTTGVYLYEAFHAAMVTALLYLFGGTSFGMLVVLYPLVVVHTRVLDPSASVFFSANACVLAYAALTWLESVPLVTPPRGLGTILSGEQRFGLVIGTAIMLNVLAIYVEGEGWRLRRLVARLRDTVEERTIALANVQRALRHEHEELESWVYTISHDLKGPLSSILSTVEVARMRGMVQAEEEDVFERIGRLAAKAEGMMGDLLAFFRVTSIPEERAVVDLNDIVAAVLETLAPQIAAKGVRVVVQPLPQAWAQPKKIAHVVTNLLSNAIKYVQRDCGVVEVRGELRHSRLILSIIDNGVGIPDEYRERIFELFGRVPAAEQRIDGAPVAGTGIGLAVVKRLVEANGGTVTVESRPGSGTSFHVDLPRPPHGHDEPALITTRPGTRRWQPRSL